MASISDILNAYKLKEPTDILTILPKSYMDIRPTKKYTFDDEEECRFFGTIQNMIIRKTSRFYSIELKVSDATNEDTKSVMIYNQPNYSYILKDKTVQYFFITKYSRSRKVYVAKKIYSKDKWFVKAGILPQYPLHSGISNQALNETIEKVLNKNFDPNFDVLPSIVTEKLNLMPLYVAYKNVHFPAGLTDPVKGSENLKRAINRFKFQNALEHALKIVNNLAVASKLQKQNNTQISLTQLEPFLAKVRDMGILLTDDQIAAYTDILNRLNSNTPMYHLLMGDVGTGKTIVAFITIYANCLRGGQTAFMTPRTLLVKQHYDEALKFFTSLGINCCLYSPTLKVKEKRDMLEKIKSGYYQIVFGTTGILSDQIEFQRLTYFVIDEEQKFGVNHKNKMLKNNNTCDVLLLSATPLPRTYSRIINGDMSESRLTTYYHGGRKTKTVVVSSHEVFNKTYVDYCLKLHRQVFVIVPRIETKTTENRTLVDVFTMFEEKFPGLCQSLNGRVKEDEKVKIIENFKNFSKPILIASNVIEVGIDVSTAGLIVIYDANYFGLSVLHQMRGRVGRDGTKSCCLLVYDGEDEEIKNKLKVLEYTENGEEITKHDVQFRGSGVLLGDSQSGESNLGVGDFINSHVLYEKAYKIAQYLYKHKDDSYDISNYVDKVIKDDNTDFKFI